MYDLDKLKLLLAYKLETLKFKTEITTSSDVHLISNDVCGILSKKNTLIAIHIINDKKISKEKARHIKEFVRNAETFGMLPYISFLCNDSAIILPLKDVLDKDGLIKVYPDGVLKSKRELVIDFNDEPLVRR